MSDSIEFTIPRPGYKYPWVAVVQFDPDYNRYAWGVYSQAGSSVYPRWDGHAPTEDLARLAATIAVESS